MAGVRVPEPVCADDVAGADAGGLRFDEILACRWIAKATTLRAKLVDQIGAAMTRGKLARSSSATQKRILRVLPPLSRTVRMPASWSVWSAHSLSAPVRAHFFRASPRSTALHEVGSQVAQIIGSFGRDVRARHALGCCGWQRFGRAAGDVEAVERWIAVMRKQKVNRWQHAVLQPGDEFIMLIAPMRWLPGCSRSEDIQTNEECLMYRRMIVTASERAAEQHTTIMERARKIASD